jgi:non-ribosomal peptide synthetase component F/thioesterase domain-containing protein/aryl carrier-like protein
VAGRTRTDVENLIGFFVNTLVLRGDTADNPSLHTAVARSRDAVTGAFAHQEVPFERLVELLHPERDPAVSPFFQTIFNYQAAFSSRITLPGLGGTVEPLDNGTVRFDLEVNLIGLPDGIQGAWNYNKELFDAATVSQMVRHYRALLENALAEPDRGLLDVPLMDADERESLLALGSGGDPVPASGGIYSLFAAAAAREPNAVAVRADGRSWTYRQLMARVRQLAYAIWTVRKDRSHEWGSPESVGYQESTGAAGGVSRAPDLVGSTADRYAKTTDVGDRTGKDRADADRTGVGRAGVDRTDTVVIALERSPEFVAAVLACRAAGVTAVPIDPDSPPGHQRDVLDDANPTVVLTRRRLAEHLPPHDATVITTDRMPFGPTDEPEPAVGDTAFVRYRPDARPPVAVAVSDAALARQCAWLTTRIPLGEVLHASPPDDDLAVELLWPLTQGATVVLAPANDPATIVEVVRTENVRAVHWTPRLLEAVLATPGVERCRSLRTIICTGEPLAPHTVRACASILPGAAIYAGYANAATGLALLGDPPQIDRLGLVPMRSTPGTTVEIRTGEDHPAPVGVIGEMIINNVRTGDDARLRPDGTVEVLGKDLPEVQGVRVEPGEVEPALADHEDVTAAAVVFSGGTPTAYVCATNPEVLPALGARARRLLPKQLVPGTIVLLDRMPLLPNGKRDTPALPAVRAQARWTQQDHPRTPAEERIANVFGEVLGRDDVGVQDDFFQIGGHSLLALRLADRLRGLGVDIPVSMLFRYRTVAALADWLGQLGMRDTVDDGQPTVHRLQIGTLEPPIVLLPGAGGTALSYSGLISALPERTVYAFESGDTTADLSTMAETYRQALPGVPPVLVGWSMGGVVALEMARQIVAEGGEPPTVVMIDSFLPDDNARAVADVEQSLVESFVVGVCRELGLPVPEVGQKGLDAALAVLRSRGLVDTGLRRRYAIYRKDMLALRDYQPGAYTGPVHVIRAAESPASTLAAMATATHDVPGDHWSLLDRDHVQNLATILEEVLCALI